jgi:N-acetyl-alpha-D-glucosaminyl L-malate synthase BshA
MRLGIVCFPTYGGSGIVATELAAELARRGHAVHLFSYAAPSRLTVYHENLQLHEVPAFSYALFPHPYYTLNLASKMMEVVQEKALDLLHVHYAIPHSVSAFLVREMTGGKVRTVTTLHGTDITLVGSDPSFFPITKFAIERSDGVTAVSRYLAEETRRIFGVACPIEVIPNFVCLDRFRPPDGRAAGGRRGDAPVLIHVSNFRPPKRIPDVMEIFRLCHERMSPKPQLWLVGEGPDLALARQEVEKHHLREVVRFFGQQESVETLLAQADCFLLPSLTESFGLSALEAMACGVPVVGSDCGGLSEVVESGRTGFLHPVGDCEGMAESCARILSDPELRRRQGEAARLRAGAFSMDEGVARYERFYEGVVGA